MENKSSKLDKTLKISIIFILICTALSFFYYFLARPLLSNKSLKKCISDAQNQYEFKINEIEEKLNLIYKERSRKEGEKQELEKRQKEISDSLEMQIKSSSMVNEFNERKRKKFIENECDKISESNNRLSWAFKCATDALEMDVIRDYKNEDQDYVQVSKELDNARNEISELDKKIDEIDADKNNQEAEKDLDKEKDFCIKLY